MDINLDELFREDSAARRVAERLLTGRPMTRQELAEPDGIAVSSVNRVVERLEEAGAVILRDVDNRQAVFQVVEIRSPRRRNQAPQLDEEGKIISDQLVGDDRVIEVRVEKKRYRGINHGLANPPSVGTEIIVEGVARDGDETTVTFRASNGRKFQLDYVQNTTN